jgi:pimeloyl-ACP methyl ester carboxylesterase
MKFLIWRRYILLGAIFTVFLMAGCATMKNGLYEMAISHECRRADLTARKIEAGGMPIALLESSPDKARPAVVMLHGFAASKENWIRFARHLTDAFYVVAIDLPGHGESVKDPGLAYDIDDQVEYLKPILAQMHLQRFHMIGNSMGGAIGALYAARHPDQVKSLFLIDPAGIYAYESELVACLINNENPLLVEEEADFDRLMDFAMEKRPFIPWPVKSVMAERMIARKQLNKQIFADIRTNHDYYFKSELKQISAPTKILWGREDRVINWKNASVFDRLIPNSEKTILDGVGHAPMIEVPEKTAGLFKAFVASTTAIQAANE